MDLAARHLLNPSEVHAITLGEPQSACSKNGFAMAAPTCSVSLDFTTLSLEAPVVRIEGVPINETAQTMVHAVASMMGVSPSEVGLLRADNDSVVNPMTPLSSLLTGSCAELNVIPRDRVGGNGIADNPEGDLDDAADKPHPGRRRASVQPEPTEYQSQHPSKRWTCTAMGEQQGNGKNKAWRTVKSGLMTGPTRDDVIQRRERWLHEFTHPKHKAPPSGKRFAPTEQRGPREKRQVAPSNMVEPQSYAGGPSSGQARAGPGRGHTMEVAGPSKLEEPIRIEQLKANANWFEQAAARKVSEL